MRCQDKGASVGRVGLEPFDRLRINSAEDRIEATRAFFQRISHCMGRAVVSIRFATQPTALNLMTLGLDEE